MDDNKIESSELFCIQLQLEEGFDSNNVQLIPDIAKVLIQDNDGEFFHCKIVCLSGSVTISNTPRRDVVGL